MVMNGELIQSLKHQTEVRRDKLIIDEKLVQGCLDQVAVLQKLKDTVDGALGKATNQYNIVKDNLGKRLVDVIRAEQPKK